MDIGINIVFLFIVSVSYAWGMRGSIIGGQKGAMLPGALIGIFFAWMSGCDLFREYFYIFAAVGAAGVYFGGEMTYGETLGLTMKGMKQNGFWRGMAGLFVKGWLWLGICAGFLCITAATLSGKYYKPVDIIIYVSLLMPLFYLGKTLINRNPEKDKMPKIYFSVTRGECWGGMLAIYVMTLIFACLHGNLHTVYFMLTVSIFCGASWVIAQFAHVYTPKNRFIDNWKIMETVFGALIAISFTVSQVLCDGSFNKIRHLLSDEINVYQPLKPYEMKMVIVWAVLFAVSVAYLFFKRMHMGDRLEQLKQQSLVTDEEYSNGILKREKSKESKLTDITETISDVFGFFAFGCMPLLSAVGAHKIAMITCSFSLMWVLTEKTGWVLFNYRKHRNIVRLVMLTLCAAVLICSILFSFNIIQIWLLYTLTYYLMQIVWLFRPVRIKSYKLSGKSVIWQLGSLSSVQAYFTLCVMIMLVDGLLTF